jgi:phosphatidylserine decarboxylase
MPYKLVDWFPKSFLSFIVGLLVDVRFPGWLLRPAIKLYCGFYKVNVEESKLPIESFKTFNEFFTRELKTGVRPMSHSPVVHPCDALLVEANAVKDGHVLSVKGQAITVEQLFGPLLEDKPEALNAVKSGYHYALYYLSPKDYHRVHHPVQGRVTRSVHIPGELWPVNNWALKKVEQLFFKNERVVCEVEMASSKSVYIAMVGALNVGRMTMAFDKKICTNKSRWSTVNVTKYKEPIVVNKGDELGRFNMGSSVVMLIPSEMANASGWSIPVAAKVVTVNSALN